MNRQHANRAKEFQVKSLGLCWTEKFRELGKMNLSPKSAYLGLGLLLGAGGGATYAGLEWRKREPVQTIAVSHDDFPEAWLFEPGTTFEDLFPEEELRAALLSPASIRIHEAREGGPLKVNRWEFMEDAVIPDEPTADRLKHALGSISSYRPATACAFHADVLLRIEKNGVTHDLVFCFGCGDIAMGHGGPSMSDDGRATFLKCFCDALPDATALHERRAGVEGRH
jgi:hypothetical protein